MTLDQYISSGVLELYVCGVLPEEEMALIHAKVQESSVLREEVERIEAVLLGYANEEMPNYQVNEEEILVKARILEQERVEAEAKEASDPKSKKNVKKLETAPEQKRPTMTAEPARVMAMNTQGREHASTGGGASRSRNRLAIAASWILLAMSVVGNGVQYNKLSEKEDSIASLRKELKSKEDTYTALKASMETKDQFLALYENDNVLKLVLTGAPDAPEAKALVFWDKEQKKVFAKAGKLPILERGKQFQLWAIDLEGKPVDAGMLSLDKNEKGLMEMKQIANAQAFAITIEPAGGSPSPTSSIVAQVEIKA